MNEIDRGVLILAIAIFISGMLIYEGAAYVARALGEHSDIMLYALARGRENKIQTE